MNDIVSKMGSREDNWRPPSELTKSLPRDTALTKQAIFLIVASTLAMAIALVAGILTATKLRVDGPHRKGSDRVPPDTLLYIGPLVALLVPAIMTVRIQRQRRLLANGRVAQGRLLKVHWSPGKNDGGHYKATYEFSLEAGSKLTGTTRGNRGRFGSEGDTVAVLYDPDNPGRNDLYPMMLVKVAEF